MAQRSRLFNQVLLSVENVSLSFGGVKALSDISFDIAKGEIRAIIGPNGAGKSSMLNCINGFYHPQQGAITYKGVKRQRMRPNEAAEQGIARTFQNIAAHCPGSKRCWILECRCIEIRRLRLCRETIRSDIPVRS